MFQGRYPLRSIDRVCRWPVAVYLLDGDGMSGCVWRETENLIPLCMMAISHGPTTIYTDTVSVSMRECDAI